MSPESALGDAVDNDTDEGLGLAARLAMVTGVLVIFVAILWTLYRSRARLE